MSEERKVRSLSKLRVEQRRSLVQLAPTCDVGHPLTKGGKADCSPDCTVQVEVRSFRANTR